MSSTAIREAMADGDMRTANALLELPQTEGVLDAGASVTALLIGEL